MGLEFHWLSHDNGLYMELAGVCIWAITARRFGLLQMYLCGSLWN